MLATSAEVQKVLKPKVFDEKEYDRERKAKQRASGRELFIPVPKNIKLRNECLGNPELLLTTYFPLTYYEPFTADRRDMLNSIRRAALYGGDQAIAASRGEGKTTNAVDGAFCLMIAALSFFPVIIAKNQDAAADELKALRERILASERFVEDFPEIGIPLAAVGPQTANARLLTVGGKFIGMYLGAKHFALPNVPDDLLPHWPEGLKSCANGSVIGAVGIEGRIRGFKFRSHRPTLAIIDDVEDKDSVRNDDTIAKIEEIIEEDIAGMGASSERISRVYLCTTLNRRCNAYKYTDPKQKPSWNGRRYRKMIKPPERMDLVEQYIELRKGRAVDDPDARVAYRFWRDNKDEIERGCQVSNPYSYSKKIHLDGEPLELSTCHAYYNRVADVGQKAVSTEVDNDPPIAEEIKTIELTYQMVLESRSRCNRGEKPEWVEKVVRGIDLGKTDCCFVDIGFAINGTGAVLDYGKFYTHDIGLKSSNEAIELALIHAITSFVNGRNDSYNIDYAFVDSGYRSDAVYEACRRLNRQNLDYFPLKGPDSAYRQPKPKEDGSVRCFFQIHCNTVRDRDGREVFLFHPNTEYWKNWIQERWLSDTWNANERVRGSMALFDSVDPKEDAVFAKSMISERMEQIPLPGKAYKSEWKVIDRHNNHYLDAAGYACAAASCLGVRLVEDDEPQQPVAVVQPREPKKFLDPYGRPFLASRR